jgi:hypothetical protein
MVVVKVKRSHRLRRHFGQVADVFKYLIESVRNLASKFVDQFTVENDYSVFGMTDTKYVYAKIVDVNLVGFDHQEELVEEGGPLLVIVR